MIRALIAALGLAALAWGGWLAWEFASASTRDGLQAAAWFVGGPVLHDGLVAPLAGVLGLLLARHVSPPWRAPLATGGILSGVLVLLAIPLLWRPFGVATNPGLHDGHYVLGLLVALAVVWLGVLTAGLVRARLGA